MVRQGFQIRLSIHMDHPAIQPENGEEILCDGHIRSQDEKLRRIQKDLAVSPGAEIFRRRCQRMARTGIAGVGFDLYFPSIHR